MNKLLLYGHGGAYNHGAEAILRGSLPEFRQAGVPILLSTHFPAQDREFGLDKLVDRLIPADLSLAPHEKAMPDLAGRERAAAQIYRDALAQIDSGTVCIGVGGDNYCYPNWHRQSVFHHTAKERGAKSVLWGCSVQPEMIDTHLPESQNEKLKSHPCQYNIPEAVQKIKKYLIISCTIHFIDHHRNRLVRSITDLSYSLRSH